MTPTVVEQLGTESANKKSWVIFNLRQYFRLPEQLFIWKKDVIKVDDGFLDHVHATPGKQNKKSC